jgi:hypothetical protein
MKEHVKLYLLSGGWIFLRGFGIVGAGVKWFLYTNLGGSALHHGIRLRETGVVCPRSNTKECYGPGRWCIGKSTSHCIFCQEVEFF